MHIRDACLDDLPNLSRIKPAPAVHGDRIREGKLPTFRYLVLEQAGGVIGFACLVFKRPASWSDADDERHLPQIVDIQIEERERGKGYGSWFIQKIHDCAAAAGQKEIYLSVDPADNSRAFDLYKRLGYKQIQPRPYLTTWAFTDSDGNRHEGKDWTVDMVKTLE